MDGSSLPSECPGTSTGHRAGRKRASEQREVASAAVRAVQIVNEGGPSDALKLADVPEPDASHMLTPGSGMVPDLTVPWMVPPACGEVPGAGAVRAGEGCVCAGSGAVC